MPATLESVNQVLNSGEWTDSEKWVVKWQFGLLGDFEKALAEAIKRADEMNLIRLNLGFPVQVNGFYEWSRGDLAIRLRAAGIEI